MANRSLKYFMREEAKKDIVVTVPGPSTIKDEDGNVVELEIKVLSNAEIEKINSMYRTRVPAKDKKGNYIVQNNELVFKTEKDTAKAYRHIMVEALQYPNLKDEKLKEFFGCVDITDMPYKVFPTNEEYSYVSRQVLMALGMINDDSAEKVDQDLDDAKN